MSNSAFVVPGVNAFFLLCGQRGESNGGVAMTGEFNVCYRGPVQIGGEMTVRAWIGRRAAPLHVLATALIQGGRFKAAATAKFMERTWAPGSHLFALADPTPEEESRTV